MDTKNVFENGSDGTHFVEDYKVVLDSFHWNNENISNIKQCMDQIIDSPYGRNASKPLIDHVIVVCKEHINDGDSPSMGIFTYLLGKLSTLNTHFLDQELRIRNIIASYHESRDETFQAAQILLDGMNGDRRLITDVQRFEIYVRVIRNYLNCDRTELAQSILSRAALSRANIDKVPQESEIHFLLCQARILDINRKFFEASVKYYNVFQELMVNEADRNTCLKKSIICAILSPAGPARSQQLRKLYVDDGAMEDEELFSILKKVYLDRLLLQEDVKVLQKTLSPHQLVVVEDGITVLQRAVVDHNVLSVSKIYDNIGLDVLARILGLDASRAEVYTAHMISQKRLNAKIDQVDKLVYFGDVDLNQSTAFKSLTKQDQRILLMCSQLEDIVGLIQKKHPDITSGSCWGQPQTP